MAEIVPQIDYTSRDYSSIRNDLINSIEYFAPQWKSRDSSDLGIVLLEMYAYVGDLMSFYIDRAANEAFLTTATRRSSLLSMANLLGYSVSQGSVASTDLVFTNTSDGEVIIPPRTQVTTETIMTSGVTPVTFETTNTDNVTLNAGDTVTILSKEGYTVIDEILTSAFNGLPSQEFRLSETGVDVSSIEITVGSTSYQRVEYLIESPGTYNVFSTYVDADGYVYVVFGDNIGGRIPTLNAEITATYRVITGSAGNVLANTLKYIITSYSGGGLAVTNPGAAAGGSDEESTASIRQNAPNSLRALNRAVTLQDYASLAVQVSGVGKAVADASSFNNVQIYMGLLGSPGVDELGDPLTTWTDTASDVTQYLFDKIPPGVSVVVAPPVMVPITVELSVKVRDSYKQQTVEQDVINAVKALFEYDYLGFSQRVTQQSILVAIGLVQGVEYANLTSLYGHEDMAGLADVVCEVYEIPYLETLNVTSTGGVV